MTGQVDYFVDDADKDHLERVKSLLEKVFVVFIVVVLEHVVVVRLLAAGVVVHRAVGVDHEQGGGRRGGEGDGGRPGQGDRGHLRVCALIPKKQDLDDGALRNGEQGLLELSPVDIEQDVDLFPGSP